MTFTAMLVRGSAIHRLWREHHRTGGAIHGVPFAWASSGDYFTGILTAEQVGVLRTHPAVRLEAVDVPARPFVEAPPEAESAKPPTLSLPPRVQPQPQQPKGGGPKAPTR